jgi:hypothetical protein
MLESLIIPIAIAIVIWVAADYFSPHPLITLVVKLIVFVWILFKLFGVMGIHA